MAYNNNYGNNGGKKHFENSGTLGDCRKSNDRSPDMSGDFTLDGDVLRYIMDNAHKGSVKLSAFGRRRIGRDNKSFISLTIAVPKEPNGNQGGYRQGGYPQGQQQGYQQQRGSGYQGGYPPQGQTPPRSNGYADRSNYQPQRQGGYPARQEGPQQPFAPPSNNDFPWDE